jgi:hypothetical protein
MTKAQSNGLSVMEQSGIAHMKKVFILERRGGT